jgi:2-polyprenyl-6-methoxyphenol hydroxylase-like FAD-dependent oxidoreductase
MSEVDVDVVVVGARCAGAATARRLAEEGLRVIAIDRATFPSDTVSTAALAWHGSALLQRWGLWDALVATGVPVTGSLGVKVGGAELVAPAADGSPGFLAPRRTVLDSLLVDAARDAGAEVWEGTSLDGVVTDGGRVTGVRVRTPDGRTCGVQARLVVGADGSSSRLAGAVDALVYDAHPSSASGMYAFFEGSDLDHPAIALVSGFMAFAFPTHDGLTCLAVTRPDDRFAELLHGGGAVFADAVESASPALGDVVRRSRRRSRFHAYRARPGFYRVPPGPGWVLVGDAGHYMDPFTGQGIANAFLSAHLASEAIIGGLGGSLPLGDSLDRYRRARDQLTAPMHAVTHELAALTWTDETLLPLFLRYREAAASLGATVSEWRSPQAAGAGSSS